MPLLVGTGSPRMSKITARWADEWNAWTDPEQVAQWWGPRGMPTDVRALDVRQVCGALENNQTCAGNVVGEIPAALHRNRGVLAGMDDQGWRGDRRQDRPHVDPERRFE